MGAVTTGYFNTENTKKKPYNNVSTMLSHTKFDYGIESTISQCGALAGVSFLQMGIGIQLFCSSIVIHALRTHMEDETEWLTMYRVDAYWFDRLMHLCTPLGCALSTLVLNRLGHINCMIISNVPFIVAHLIMVYAHNINILYASSVLMGVSVGFASGRITAYVGEVCEPKLRGALMSFTYIFFYLGGTLITTTATITNQWRLAMLINLLIPVLTILILLMSPDSPMWLLTKGKTEEAKRTLGKLRGWISYEMCSSEFREMVDYTRNSQSTDNDTDKYCSGGDESPWRQLLRPEVYRPFRLLVVYIFFRTLMSGKVFLEHLGIIRVISEPANDLISPFILETLLFRLAGILTVFLVNKLGKRFITLLTLSICAFCHISFGLIGRYWKDPSEVTSWLMIILYLTNMFVSAFGMMPISWALLTELFPMKSRNITCGIGSTLHFMFSFLMFDFFWDLIIVVDLFVLCIVFGVAGLFGCVYFYYNLPETENKTLQEITQYFK